MVNDVLCPTCGHSLAFHMYDYGSCQAPLGGLTSKNVCGCPVTIHVYIQNLQVKDSAKEFESLEIRYRNCMDELVNARAQLILNSQTLATLVSKRIDFLESKLKTVRELLDKTKSFEKSVFVISYRNEVIKIINEIILELEKDYNK